MFEHITCYQANPHPQTEQVACETVVIAPPHTSTRVSAEGVDLEHEQAAAVKMGGDGGDDGARDDDYVDDDDMTDEMHRCPAKQNTLSSDDLQDMPFIVVSPKYVSILTPFPVPQSVTRHLSCCLFALSRPISLSRPIIPDMSLVSPLTSL